MSRVQAITMRGSASAAKGRLSRADLEAVLGVVRLAYEGLTQQAAWAEILRHVRALFHAQDAFLVRAPLEPGATSFLMTEGVEPGLQSSYSTRFTVPLTNPSIAAVLDLGFDGTFITSDLVPWQQMEKTEFFQAIRSRPTRSEPPRSRRSRGDRTSQPGTAFRGVESADSRPSGHSPNRERRGEGGSRS